MKITAVSVESFKRIEQVAITPDADRVLVLIGGRNAQGKTSLLDALTSVFGGKNALPADPVRHGAEAAEIRVELDGGALIVKRVVDAAGESALEVREDGVKVRSPQAVLDKLVSGRFLDPLQFLALPPKDQRATLLAMVGDADRLADLEKKRTRAFDKRTEVGREAKKAEGELARIPVITPAEPIDVAALTLESRQIEERLRTVNGIEAELKSALDAKVRADADVDRARRALLAAEAAQDDAIRAVHAAQEAWNVVAGDAAKIDPRRDEILFEIRRAQDHNTKVAADTAAMKRRAETEAEAARLRAEADACTAAIAEIDKRKAEILAAAALPVPGLGIDDASVTLNGVPLAQASGAERHRVALALAIAASPNLKDVWIRDGALLDEDSLREVERHAAAAGVRVWVERVGTRDPGCIVIHDGRVVEPASSEAA